MPSPYFRVHIVLASGEQIHKDFRAEFPGAARELAVKALKAENETGYRINRIKLLRDTGACCTCV